MPTTYRMSILKLVCLTCLAYQVTPTVVEDFCSTFNQEQSEGYWSEVKNCSACASTNGCGFCLSSLLCLRGDNIGPSDGTPCPSWVNSIAQNECPVEPTCSERLSCSECATVDDDCAWCSSQNACMTVADVFSKDCRGTVFDLPCPESFVAVNRVVGNLVVESDTVFGGGYFQIKGN